MHTHIHAVIQAHVHTYKHTYMYNNVEPPKTQQLKVKKNGKTEEYFIQNID